MIPAHCLSLFGTAYLASPNLVLAVSLQAFPCIMFECPIKKGNHMFLSAVTLGRNLLEDRIE